MDAKNALERVTRCHAAGLTAPMVSYVCFDGLPVSRKYLDAQRACAAVWATSGPGAAYLMAEGIPVAGIAPPGVDPAEFPPLPDKLGLRRAINLRCRFLVESSRLTPSASNSRGPSPDSLLQQPCCPRLTRTYTCIASPMDTGTSPNWLGGTASQTG